jgi:secernin
MTNAMPSRPWSCDTFAVQAQHSAMGGTLLAKNSDRPARESQPLRYLGARHGGEKLRLAYVEIDDAAETIPHLGSSPYWCWGHELGLNAHGVAIGNEAIFTRDLADNALRYRGGEHVETGILGMELLRLGLERGDSAHAAVEVMTSLVERYGQWGSGMRGEDRAAAAYDNSYLVADPSEIWVLETTGRRWAAKRVEEPTWSLSNEPTLREDWTECAADLPSIAASKGWSSSEQRFDFAAAVTDPKVALQVSHIRLQRSRTLLAQYLAQDRIGFEQARRVLSDHYEDTFLQGPKFNPARPDFLTLCMHESPAGFTWGNTAASTIMVLPDAGTPVMWWAPTTPCTSIYIPLTVQAGVPEFLSQVGTARGAGPNPEEAEQDGYADDSYWWRFQRLLETVNGDPLGNAYADRQPVVRAVLDELQAEFVTEAEALLSRHASGTEWANLTKSCVQRATVTVDELTRKIG